MRDGHDYASEHAEDPEDDMPDIPDSPVLSARGQSYGLTPYVGAAHDEAVSPVRVGDALDVEVLEANERASKWCSARRDVPRDGHGLLCRGSSERGEQQNDRDKRFLKLHTYQVGPSQGLTPSATRRGVS